MITGVNSELKVKPLRNAKAKEPASQKAWNSLFLYLWMKTVASKE